MSVAGQNPLHRDQLLGVAKRDRVAVTNLLDDTCRLPVKGSHVRQTAREVHYVQLGPALLAHIGKLRQHLPVVLCCQPEALRSHQRVGAQRRAIRQKGSGNGKRLRRGKVEPLCQAYGQQTVHLGSKNLAERRVVHHSAKLLVIPFQLGRGDGALLVLQEVLKIVKVDKDNDIARLQLAEEKPGEHVRLA